MGDCESLSHSKWECKCHVVFLPKHRRKTLYEQLRKNLGEVPGVGEAQRECKIARRAFDASSRTHDDFDIAEVCGVAGDWVDQEKERESSRAGIQGESNRNFAGYFWTRVYFVSTEGRDEETIRAYIRHHERENERLEQMNLLRRVATERWHKQSGAALATPASRFERLIT